MIISEVEPKKEHFIKIVTEEGTTGLFDVKPYLDSEAFLPLRDMNEFMKISNGGYFVEWECGADLSADTIEARMQAVDPSKELNPA